MELRVRDQNGNPLRVALREADMQRITEDGPCGRYTPDEAWMAQARRDGLRIDAWDGVCTCGWGRTMHESGARECQCGGRVSDHRVSVGRGGESAGGLVRRAVGRL